MRICDIAGCGEKHKGKGLCQSHYDKFHHKIWYQKNRAAILVKQKVRNDKNKERRIKYGLKYRQKNKEDLRQRYVKDKEKISKQQARYYAENREKILVRVKRYNQTPQGKLAAKAHAHNRRLQKKGLTLAIVQRVYEDNIKKYGTLTCILCNQAIRFGDDSLEHNIPLSKGGTNDYENLGIAHVGCNTKKYTMTFEEWMHRKDKEKDKEKENGRKKKR